MPERRRFGRSGADPSPGAWIDDTEGADAHKRLSGRVVAAVAAAVLCLAVVAVPVAVVLTSGKPPKPAGTNNAQHQVLSALSATIDSGSFNMTYSEQAPTQPTSGGTTTTTCPTGMPWKACGPAGSLQGLAISGQGTIDTDPFAMVASSEVPGLGQVTVRADGTNVWEMGGGYYGLSPGSKSTGPGSPLSGFADLVSETLGARQGALSMMGLASPTGYLELDQNAITSADQIGTGTVDGASVTIYQVFLAPQQLSTVPGATPQEATAIQNALDVLEQEGYKGTSAKVSIDSVGFIRQTISVAMFSDGATQTSEATFSDFGCAGRVLMPGQSGTSSPPEGCVSADH